jgi:hypothetical protein
MKIAMTSLLLFFALSLLACDGESTEANTPPNLSGEWFVSGKGLQSDCENSLDNYRYEISFNEPWIIESLADENIQDAPAESSENQESESPEKRILVLKSEVENLRDFEGSVSAEQVQFSFIDETPEGDIFYHFFGEIEGATEIKGHFLAEGPGSCVTRLNDSSFRVRIY